MNEPGPLQQRVKITNPLGLHMRAASVFAAEALRFQSDVRVRYGEQISDGKSWLQLMMMMVHPEHEVILEVDGTDAAEALAHLGEVLSAPEANDTTPIIRSGNGKDEDYQL